jgi:mitochondrial import inner membrane translocase subunit TIM50
MFSRSRFLLQKALRIQPSRWTNARIAMNYSTRNDDSAFAQAMRDKQEKERAGTEEKEEKKASGNGIEEDQAKQNASIGWAVGLGLLASYIYLGQTHESEDVEGENAFQAHNRRSFESLKDSYEYFFYPPTKKLLPPLPPQLHRDHTLCIELTDALTHLVWDRDLGWRVAIRPHAKQFLYILHQYFELVVFTNTPSHLAQPVIEALDNFGLFHYRLYREHHRLDKGNVKSFNGIDKHLKDLSFLNRDLSKVIVVDTKQECLETNPENGILIKSWQGEKGDHEMEKYGIFLQGLTLINNLELVVFLSTQKIADVRPVLSAIKAHDCQDLPRAWELHKQHMKKANTASLTETETKPKEVEKPLSILESITYTLNALVGNSGSIVSSANAGPVLSGGSAVTKIEKYCAETRKMLEKELESHMKNVESHRKEQEEMMKKQLEEMKKSDLKLIDYITGNVPQPGMELAKKE